MTSLISTISTLTLITIFNFTSVNAQSTFKVDAGADINHCLGEYTELHATVTGGVEPFQISWSPDIEMSATDVENPSVSPTVPTVYRVVVTDATGAVAKDEIKVKVFSKPEIITNLAVNIQAGESVTLMADVQGGTAPYTFSWKPNTGLAGVNTANPTVNPKNSTIYNVTVKDSKGCINTGQVTVNVTGGSLGSVSGNR